MREVDGGSIIRQERKGGSISGKKKRLKFLWDGFSGGYSYIVRNTGPEQSSTLYILFKVLGMEQINQRTREITEKEKKAQKQKTLVNTTF